MNRRLAILSAMAVALLGAMPASQAIAATTPTTLKPRRLTKGDTVGLIAPASNSRENEEIRAATDIVESLGFRVKHGKHLFARTAYLAGTDQQRADDVNMMFADQDINAIICLRGGYGTPRILPWLDYELIARNPKVLLGYSDITAIITAIHVKTGLVGYHGPVALHNFSDYTLAEFKKVLMQPASQTAIAAARPFSSGEGRVDTENRITRIAGRTARGPLIGGNLSIIISLMGTEYEPDFEGRILFLEDAGEAPYRIDRMLTQLRLANKLRQVAGIAFGKFTETQDSGNTFSVEEVLRDRCADLGVPVVSGLMIGHIEDQSVVPVGIEARLDADAGTLELQEPAVL